MSDTITFNNVQIGDAGALLVPTVEALARRAEPMLWSTFALADDSSPNWLYRIPAAIAVVRNPEWKLVQYVASLRAALGGAKADLVWKSGSVVRLRWPGARLDRIRPATADECRRAALPATIVLEFTSAEDPE